ncbi:hypothetical protein BJX61DRAFT_550590 [Aspergillus egyptiacus]|nr:hypothetical protein BJX61DRAFT_550590 [Aspergillus egyptiacus]
MSSPWPIKLSLLGCLIAPTVATLHWSPCSSNPVLDCATLTVPLEYAEPHNGAVAHIPLARYKATVPLSERKGSILTNPGGAGSSGINFLSQGAGEGISTISGGFYDVVSWDPRGVGAARPLLQCHRTLGEEMNATVPTAAEVEYFQYRNQSYMPTFHKGIQEYDSAVGEIADDCVQYNSSALYTSSTAYVARDMIAIADAVEEKPNATVNYWGFSYGTILGTEFIQTFPERVGKVVLDGIFDAEANSHPYTSQLPNDQLSVPQALHDLVTYCVHAGPAGCALLNAPGSRNTTADQLKTRLFNLQKSLYRQRLPVPDGSWSITSAAYSFFMYSFLKLPVAWPVAIRAISRLERGDPTLFASLMTGATGSTATTNTSAPATGALAGWPIQCTDNAPSSHISVSSVARLVLDISLSEQTPWLNAGLSTLAFCRNFPDTRPRVPNLGASKLTSLDTDAALTAHNASVLIVNPLHDPMTPADSAQRLHEWLPTSSQLLLRRGPGHTTLALASLGLAQAIQDYWLDGTVPATEEVYDLSQVVFGPGIQANTTTPEPVFNGSLTQAERALLEATYLNYLGFVALPA